MSSSIPSLKQIRKLDGKRVLVRVDFNVPVVKKKVMDEARLIAALPTIQYLTERGARVILVSHLGRPEGKKKVALSLQPVAERLSQLLRKKVIQLPDYKGEKVEQVIARMKPGGIVMLENIRFSKDEEGNKGALGEYLSTLADVFVLDGFGVAHRADASVVGVTPHLPSYAGLLLEKEVSMLSNVVTKAKKPIAVILGGAKISTKLGLISIFEKTADYMNSVIRGAGGLSHIKLLSPAFNMTNPVSLEIIASMKDNGANFNGVEAIAGNSYNLSGKTITNWVDEFMANSGFGGRRILITRRGFRVCGSFWPDPFCAFIVIRLVSHQCLKIRNLLRFYSKSFFNFGN